MVLDKWIRNIYKIVIPVVVTCTPEYDEQTPFNTQTQPTKLSVQSDDIMINVKIRTSSGMDVFREYLDYISLRVFIEKLEDVLC